MSETAIYAVCIIQTKHRSNEMCKQWKKIHILETEPCVSIVERAGQNIAWNTKRVREWDTNMEPAIQQTVNK